MLDKAKVLEWIKEKIESQSDPAGDVAHCLFYLRLDIESGLFDASLTEEVRELKKGLEHFNGLLSIEREEVRQLREERDRYKSYIDTTNYNSEKIAIEAVQLKGERDKLVKAIKSAHLSLTWSNTENQIPHAVWALEEAVPEIKGTTQEDETNESS